MWITCFEVLLDLCPGVTDSCELQTINVLEDSDEIGAPVAGAGDCEQHRSHEPDHWVDRRQRPLATELHLSVEDPERCLKYGYQQRKRDHRARGNDLWQVVDQDQCGKRRRNWPTICRSRRRSAPKFAA